MKRQRILSWVRKSLLLISLSYLQSIRSCQYFFFKNEKLIIHSGSLTCKFCQMTLTRSLFSSMRKIYLGWMDHLFKVFSIKIAQRDTKQLLQKKIWKKIHNLCLLNKWICVTGQVREKKCEIRRDYDNICKVEPEFTQNSFEDFCWARTTVSSRVFGITIHEIKTDALVPFAG